MALAIIAWTLLVCVFFVLPGAICKVEIKPSSQIVVAGSTVVFSCESDAPGTHSWLQEGKAIMLAEDGIQVRQVSADESVLVIARADTRRHNVAFSCVVQYGDRKRETKRTKLDFVNPNRLPSGFPRVRSQIGNYGLSGVPQEGPATVVLRCALETPEVGVDWRWIKTGSDNVTTVLDDDSGRIDEDDGILRISPAETGDSGTYMCVADNSRGNAYGPSATINIQIDKPQQCKRDGETYQVGETRQSAGDPCMTCMCREGADLVCLFTDCRPRRCPEGQEFHPSNVTCCDGVCRPKDKPQQCKRDGETYQVGETRQSAGDPCMTCMCREGADLLCVATSCRPKRCPEGQEFHLSNVTCCDGECRPKDKSQQCQRDGETYRIGETRQSAGDPCMTCMCREGADLLCRATSCQPKRCPEGQEFHPSNVTCCDGECRPKVIPKPVTSRQKEGCRAENGSLIPYGVTVPSADPCVSCTCFRTSGLQCRVVGCVPKRCPLGQVFRKLEGKCCDGDCVPEDQCVGYGGQKVREGYDYQPGADPCLTCICEDGRAAFCRSIACAPSNMQCQNQTRVPGKCCQYDCLDTLMSEEIVLGVLYVRQVGPGAILVQWKVPEGSEGLIELGSNMTVYVTVMDGRNSYTKALAAGQVRSYMYHVRDYELGKRMLVTVNGTLGRAPDVKIMVTRAAEVSLDNKVRTTLNLNDALGHVFESRGSDPWGWHSIPWGFKPVVRSSKVKNMLNPDSFHRVETSVYDEEPCPQKACGLVRFFLYTLDGEVTNVMSLLFANDQDFEWAEAHL